VGLEGGELMPFARPSLDELRAQAAADIAAAIPGADPLLPVSNLGILADILAEAANGMDGYLDWIARQGVPFTAVDEAFEGWAALKGVTRKSATPANGQATFPGAPGNVLPAGTPISRGDGQAYVTSADAIVGGGGFVTAQIVAVEPGSAGTLVTGSGLALGVAVSGVGGSGVATAGLPGVDVEDFDAFRTRTLGIYANPPQGGAIADYEEWAEQVAGVTRAWCVPHGKGPGTVAVYVMMDDAEAAFGGFPQGLGGCATLETRDTHATGDLLAVADHIYPLQPVTALVYAVAPLSNHIDLTISLPGASAALKAAIELAIDGAYLAYGSPGGTINKSRLDSAIDGLAGTDGFVITVEACDHGSISPGVGNITSDAGYLPVRGVTSWV
jgi:uncharacterized phage protein gp47/JayE